MNLLTKRSAVLGTVCLLTACVGTKPETVPLADKDVIARCAPAEALLDKNYSETRGFDLGIVNAGESVSYQGAVLSAEAADRVSKVNSMCKAWVAGTITDQQYSKFLLSTLIDSSVTLPGGTGQSIPLDELLERIEELETIGAIPVAQDGNDLRAELQRLIDMDPTSRVAELETDYDSLRDRVDTSVSDLAQVQSAMARQIQSLSDQLEAIESRDGPQAESLTEGPYRVYFATDSSELTFSATKYLDELVSKNLRQTPRLEVRGYTDPRGSTTHNQDLSERRAQAVAEYLRTTISAEVGVFGENVSPETSEDNSRLRYVEIVVPDTLSAASD